MYKLVRFEATNVAGFQAGMGRKSIDIDLRKYADKDIFVIIGDNGVGKSTFLSMIHPWSSPTDGRSKFIVQGKEGIIKREYQGDDGTTLISKCIYTPKKGEGHNGKYHLELIKEDGDRIELNPNGNLSSYQSLLYTYFGINKDFLSFASYNTAVSSIVSMTDAERKASVDSLIPNVKRYEVAYGILNEKYKELNSMIRNIAQKIVSLRDEESLESDFKRLTEEMQKFTEEREDRIKKLSKMEGRLRELTSGTDVDEMINHYNAMVVNLASFDSEIDRTYAELMRLYDKLDIEPDRPGSVNFKGIDAISSNIMKYERKIASSAGALTGYKGRVEQLRNELNQTEHDIAETESVLYSIQTQDIGELEKTKKAYLEQLTSLRYTHMQDKFDGMTYDEAIQFSRIVVMMDQMIHALYDEYGEIVSLYFGSDNWGEYTQNTSDRITTLTATIQTSTAKKDQIYRTLIEKEQYKQLQSILDKRPKTCTIDTCPFISTALKYQGIADEIAVLKDQLKDISIQLTELTHECSDAEKKLAIHNDAQTLIQYLQGNGHLLAKYLGITDLKVLYKAISNGTWGNLLDIMKLKEIASILSEKELYLQITKQRIPEIDHAIELAKVYGTNRDLLSHQLDRLNHTRQILRDELTTHKMHISISEQQCDRYNKSLALWRRVSECIDRYRKLITEQLETQAQVSEQDEKIKKIKDLIDRCGEQKEIIRELDDLIRARNPKREQVKLDLDAVRRLKIEKLEVERDFTVINVIRSIVSPGKMIRRELIDIYMYDICTIANQLLLNTFDGKLYLKEFLISDKQFTIPYVYNGSEGSDISFASASQQSTIASAISLAILSKLVDKYGIYTTDEQDGPLNPKNKGAFVHILTSQMRYVGVNQAFIITQEPSYYEPYDPCFLQFPGGELKGKNLDIIKIE